MPTPRSIELLAPAKNLTCGIEAVNHGADAVYIGAHRFGARSAAGNSIDDIARLVAYAHTFRVRVYVTVNTLLKDEELPETERLIWQLYRIGVDALIVQDVALLALNLPPIPLHASTQMDNRTPQKVKWLRQLGFQQVVLARELSAPEIRAIYEACPMPLEVFVHGALCVSFSGQCYVSQHCFGRSANRGECAQFCRLKFDLTDSKGRVIERGKHLLSLKDMNRSDALEELMDAGVSSFKIEGRLKDVSYVKNITAYYRRRIDAVLTHRPDYRRASSGTVRTTFEPCAEKSFNRGFTRYFLHGRTRDILSAGSPKSIGEKVGVVKEVRKGCLVVAGVARFANGDGLCFFDEQGRLQGFRVNRADSNRLYPAEMPRGLRPRTVLYRNYDHDFEQLLARPSAERKIGVRWLLAETRTGYALTLTDEDGVSATVAFDCAHEEARSPQQAEQIRAGLCKLGQTPFAATDAELRLEGARFIPSSLLSEWRRCLTDRLQAARRLTYPYRYRALPTPFTRRREDEPVGLPEGTPPQLTYLANVMNRRAEDLYRRWGALSVAPALERQEPPGAALMFCRHCLRYTMGWCPRQGGNRSPFREPYYLVATDGRRFRLAFDCKNCQMKLFADE